MKKFIYGFSLLFSFTLLAQNGFVMLNQNSKEKPYINFFILIDLWLIIPLRYREWE